MRRVVLREVSRAYGRSFALHRVSMQLEAGTTTLLLGGNGAGKTTLLNILATLDAPSSGEILYDALPWQRFASIGRQHIGWVAHDALVYDELTGAENLRFYADLYGLADAGAIAERWLARVGLSEFADRRVSAYSRGMRQRLSIARALLHEPRLVLLDEPLTGLDRDGRQAMAELIAELRDQGRIVVMITHDLGLDPGVVDRLAILRRGSLTYDGPAAGAQILDKFREHA